MQDVERSCIAGFHRLLRLELVDQDPKSIPVVLGQQLEQSRCGRRLSGRSVRIICVKPGISGVDLDQVMDRDQVSHVDKIEPGRSLWLQDKRQQREMPAMLGNALGSRTIHQHGRSRLPLQTIGGKEEGQAIERNQGCTSGQSRERDSHLTPSGRINPYRPRNSVSFIPTTIRKGWPSGHPFFNVRRDTSYALRWTPLSTGPALAASW